MEQYFTLLRELIVDIGYPGAIVAGSYFGFKTLSPMVPAVADWIRGHGAVGSTNEKGEFITLATIDERVGLLASNHFHEVGETLKRIENLMQLNNQGIFQVQGTLEFIKGRINGK